MIETMDDQMVDILRAKSPLERLEIAFGMWRSAREMLNNMIAAEHRSWNEERVAREVARRMSHGAC